MGKLTKAQCELLEDKVSVWRRDGERGLVDFRDYNIRAADAMEAALAPIDWAEFEDEIADAIADSLDVDWSPRDAAKAVVRALTAGRAALSGEG